MLIAHLSDFHIFTGKPETSLVRADIIDVVRKIIADVVAFRPKIDAVMLTGDLADGGTDEDYATLRALLAPALEAATWRAQEAAQAQAQAARRRADADARHSRTREDAARARMAVEIESDDRESAERSPTNRRRQQ